MCPKNSLVTTKDKNFKEGVNDKRKKHNVVKEAIPPPIAKKNIDTVNKIEKPQESKRKKYKPSSINQTKVNYWMNKGLLKELKHKTQ